MSPVIAYVQIGPVEIAYSRDGRGAPLVLLANRGLQLSLGTELSEHFCVISPVEAPVSPAQDAGWIRGFMDALGMPPPRVVADARCAAAPIELLREDPLALDRLAVLCDGQAQCSVHMYGGGIGRLMHLHAATGMFGPADLAVLLSFLR